MQGGNNTQDKGGALGSGDTNAVVVESCGSERHGGGGTTTSLRDETSASRVDRDGLEGQ